MSEKLEQKEINQIKESVEEFFKKMTVGVLSVNIKLDEAEEDERSVVDVDIKSDEPQILIGQGGQTLFEIQKLLKTILNKKFQKIFYLKMDINDYKRKKVEYLKDIAKELADQAVLNKEEKVLSPMSAYERRIVHAELAKRTDVITESHGDSSSRHIVIKPK